MSQDISAFNLAVSLIASVTFPVGIVITAFADDSDPLDFASIAIADKAMGLNGDLVKWSKAVPITMVLNVIPGSEDDVNLEILANANRVGKGKSSARDSITATVIYPDQTTKVVTGGIITDYMPGKSASSAGRLKTRSYTFAFEALN